jgi:hypothetical protein
MDLFGQEAGVAADLKAVGFEDIGQLSLQRCFANMEMVCNLFVAGTGGNEMGYLPLTLAQAFKTAASFAMRVFREAFGKLLGLRSVRCPLGSFSPHRRHRRVRVVTRMAVDFICRYRRCVDDFARRRDFNCY